MCMIFRFLESCWFCPFQVKCYQYYPLGKDNEDEDEKVFTDVGLKVTYKSELESNYHYTARVYRVEDLEVNALEYDSLFRTICKIYDDDDDDDDDDNDNSRADWKKDHRWKNDIEAVLCMLLT